MGKYNWELEGEQQQKQQLIVVPLSSDYVFLDIQQ